MPSARVRHWKRSGFTLIELLAVLGVLGMVLFFVLPNLDNISPRAKLRSHARRLASTIELAQGEAAGSGKEFVLAYDVSKGAYWIILPPPDPSPSPTPSPRPTQNPNANKTGQNGSSTEPTAETEIPTDDPEHGLTPDLSSEQAGNKGQTNSTTSSSSSTPSTSSLNQRDTLPEEILPDEVMIQSVTPLNGKQAEAGITYIPFSALGDEGSHIVVLQLKSSSGNQSTEPPISIRFNALTRTVDFSSDKMSWQSISGK